MKREKEHTREKKEKLRKIREKMERKNGEKEVKK